MKTGKIYRQLGQHIQLLRKNTHLSQEQLAARAGINRVYMGNIEQGTKRPSLEVLAKIANALELSLAQLFSSI